MNPREEGPLLRDEDDVVHQSSTRRLRRPAARFVGATAAVQLNSENQWPE
jgi:hypothetical protein